MIGEAIEGNAKAHKRIGQPQHLIEGLIAPTDLW